MWVLIQAPARNFNLRAGGRPAAWAHYRHRLVVARNLNLVVAALVSVPLLDPLLPLALPVAGLVFLVTVLLVLLVVVLTMTVELLPPHLSVLQFTGRQRFRQPGRLLRLLAAR